MNRNLLGCFVALTPILFASASYASKPGELAACQANLRQETDPQVIYKATAAALQGSLYSGEGYTCYFFDMTPSQSLDLLAGMLSRGTLTSKQLASLGQIAAKQKTTLKDGLERKRGEDLILFAQLDYKDQILTCRHTKRQRDGTFAKLTSFITDSDKLLSFLIASTPGIKVPDSARNYGRSYKYESEHPIDPGNSQADTDCLQVFNKDRKDAPFNQAILQINRTTGAAEAAQ